MIQIGRMNKSVALQRVTRAVTPDGYTDTWVTYAEPFAAIEPASPALVERVVGATVTTPVSHLVTIWYRDKRATPQDDPGPKGKISDADRVLYRDRSNIDRALYIAGIQIQHEKAETMVLACQERAA